MNETTDRTLGAVLGPAVAVGEVHGGDCNAMLRIDGGASPVSNVIAALRPTTDCAAAKAILALRLTFPGPGADAVLAAMRPRLGTPCFNGLGPDAAARTRYGPTRNGLPVSSATKRPVRRSR